MRRNLLLVALVLFGCATEPEEPDPAETDEMVITFTQEFVIDELCFDWDGEGEGWVTGCGVDVQLYLVVENGVMLDESEMRMSGSDSLVIDGAAYGPELSANAPLVGEFSPYGSPYGPCFSGRPHHPSDDLSIWLSTWGGFSQTWVDVAVRFGGIQEAYAPFTASEPLHDSFELDSTEECYPRFD